MRLSRRQELRAPVRQFQVIEYVARLAAPIGLRGRQAYLFRLTIDELAAQPLFQLLDLTAQARLRNKQLFGDLAPLAHLFLPLLGLGEVDYRGTRQPAGRALQQAGLEPVTLAPKEGLALISGTQFIAAHAALVLERLHRCLSQADLIAGGLASPAGSRRGRTQCRYR